MPARCSREDSCVYARQTSAMSLQLFFNWWVEAYYAARAPPSLSARTSGSPECVPLARSPADTPATQDVCGVAVSHGPSRAVGVQKNLARRVWPETAVSDVVLMVCIRELRQALGDDPRAPRFIETVHRRGYRFIGDLPVTAPATAVTLRNPQPRPASRAGGGIGTPPYLAGQSALACARWSL